MGETIRSMTTIFLSQGGKMLMLYRQGGRVVNDVWVGSAGGHLEPADQNDTRTCVLRELREELNLSEKQIRNLRLRYITLRRTENEIRQNYYFFADLDETVPEELHSNEGVCKWFAYAALADLDMPFTARDVLRHYVHEGMTNDIVYGGVANGNEVIFNALPAF